jgi:hypothetical protein
MDYDQKAFLALARYPAVLTLLEACWLLGFALHQGRILVRKGMLTPLGKRRHRKSMLFAAPYILELTQDREWLSEAKDTLSAYWEKCNAAKKLKRKQHP